LSEGAKQHKKNINKRQQKGLIRRTLVDTGEERAAENNGGGG
jgi:hypothetical protein